jgi:hypothetical protein
MLQNNVVVETSGIELDNPILRVCLNVKEMLEEHSR